MIRRVRGADAGWTLRPLLIYALLALVLFGGPVIAHPAGRIIAYDDQDPGFLMWMLAWWPHALVHGLNPFITHAIFFPDGYNLTWSTSMPLPALVLAPITLTAGPVVSWNVLQLLCPTLSAFTAFLLCRHVAGGEPSRPPWAALLAGYLFGFSGYMLANLQAAPNIGMVALLPVAVLLVLRRVEGRTSPRRFVVASALALTAQFLISTEVFATGTLFGVGALLVAWAALPERRRALRHTAGLLALAYAGTAVLVSPYLYYFIAGHHYPPGLYALQADLTSFVVPPPQVALHPHGAPIAGNDVEDYLGVPLLALIAGFAWQTRRRRTTWLLLAGVLVPLVAALGAVGLLVRGHTHHVWLPWRLLSSVPLIRYAIPARFAVFALLPAVVMVALWLTRRPAAPRPRRVWPRWTLALAALACVVPAVGSHAYDTPIADPPFFASPALHRLLSSRDHVLTLPAWGPSQRWVAEAGFPFPLSTGSAGQSLPPSFLRYPIWQAMVLFGHPLPPHPAQALRRFLAAKRVTAVVMQQGYPGPWAGLLGTLGVRPTASGGVLVYRLRAA